MVGFSQVGRPLRPPRRGAAAGGAVLPERNQRNIEPRTSTGHPEPQFCGTSIYQYREGRGRVPESLWVFLVFGRSLWIPGWFSPTLLALFLSLWFCGCVSVDRHLRVYPRRGYTRGPGTPGCSPYEMCQARVMTLPGWPPRVLRLYMGYKSAYKCSKFGDKWCKYGC